MVLGMNQKNMHLVKCGALFSKRIKSGIVNAREGSIDFNSGTQMKSSKAGE
jgi:hypothetical protein